MPRTFIDHSMRASRAPLPYDRTSIWVALSMRATCRRQSAIDSLRVRARPNARETNALAISSASACVCVVCLCVAAPRYALSPRALLNSPNYSQTKTRAPHVEMEVEWGLWSGGIEHRLSDCSRVRIHVVAVCASILYVVGVVDAHKGYMRLVWHVQDITCGVCGRNDWWLYTLVWRKVI